MEDIRLKAKKLKIKSYHNKKIERLEREIAEIEGQAQEVEPEEETELYRPTPISPPKLEVKINQAGYQAIKMLGIKDDWLAAIANRYGFSKLEYIDKFKAFRCYIDDKCVDWVSVNDLSKSNGGGEVVEIITPSRPLEKSKQVIKFPWRN